MSSASAETRRIVVVGGAGAMGSIIVRDLVETAPDSFEIVVADHDEEAAKRLARAHAGTRPVEAVFCDVTDVPGTAKLLGGAFGVINSVHHRYNIPVMKAALAAGSHYCDLGGLFHVTREQLELDSAFQEKGRLALLGIGAAPGVTNVLARSAADEMEEVHEIHCLVAGVDRTAGRPSSPLPASYSIRTILEEASTPAALFTGGGLTFVDPMSGAEEVRFPEPVGPRRPARTIHSELATLPLTYGPKGVREVSFRIAFVDELDEKLRFLRTIGMLSERAVKVGSAEVAPRDVLLAVLAGLPKPAPFEGAPDEYEILRAVVRGVKDGRAIEETIDCHTPGIPEWGFGVDVDTGCPPSIVMQMLARGELEGVGALPPERAIPAAPFFAELAKRRMRIERSTILL